MGQSYLFVKVILTSLMRALMEIGFLFYDCCNDRPSRRYVNVTLDAVSAQIFHKWSLILRAYTGQHHSLDRKLYKQ